MSSQLPLKAPDATLAGVYASAVQLHTTKEEFVLDFMNLFPPAATLNARVIMTPAHAKRLAQVLADAVKRYEEQNGPVTPSAEPAQIGFNAQ